VKKPSIDPVARPRNAVDAASLPTSLKEINEFMGRLKRPNFLILWRYANRSNASYLKWLNDLSKNM
jgi:hypothetical protein